MLRALRRRFGISAARVAVRPAVPWYWRSAAALAGGAAVLGLLWLVADASGVLQRLQPGEAAVELRRLRATLDAQAAELDELRAKVAGNERQAQIDRAAGVDLAAQVKGLTAENAALKEDLAFFQSLMSTGAARNATISVNRFRLQPASTAGEFRYQMVLVQSGERMKEFQGKLQFVIDVQHDGRKLLLYVPAEGEAEVKDYQLSFKFFQRVEGTFRLTPGSVVKGMQVRVFENGTRTPKLTQSLSVL